MEKFGCLGRDPGPGVDISFGANHYLQNRFQEQPASFHLVFMLQCAYWDRKVGRQEVEVKVWAKCLGSRSLRGSAGISKARGSQNERGVCMQHPEGDPESVGKSFGR